MPSPFPGMNPYLESPAIWPDFHTSLILRIRAALNAVLPERYLASIDQHMWLEESDPNVREPDGVPDTFVTDYGAASATAVATLVAPAYVTHPAPQPRATPRRFVRITDQQRQRVVTVLELLSPSNKRGADREAYLRKRENYFQARTSLVEYDLLRTGDRLPMDDPVPPLRDYCVLVSPVTIYPRAGLWSFGVRDPIPVIPIPLDPADAPVPLDLMPCLHQAYDEARYERKIDYTQPPVPRLGDEDAAWAQRLLAARTTHQGASS